MIEREMTDKELVEKAIPIYEEKDADGAAGRARQVKEYLRIVMQSLMQHIPPSRERAIALTRLEEASMWCVKAIHSAEDGQR